MNYQITIAEGRFSVGGVSDTGRSFENGFFDTLADALRLGIHKRDGRPIFLHTAGARWIAAGVAS